MRVGDTHFKQRANDSEGLVRQGGLVVVERDFKGHGVKWPQEDTVSTGLNCRHHTSAWMAPEGDNNNLRVRSVSAHVLSYFYTLKGYQDQNFTPQNSFIPSAAGFINKAQDPHWHRLWYHPIGSLRITLMHILDCYSCKPHVLYTFNFCTSCTNL